MKTKAVVCVLALAGAGFLLLTSGTDAVAGDATMVAANLTVASVGADGEHEFVGAKKCKMCHIQAFKSWEDTTHAKALDVLKAGEAAEAKTKVQPRSAEGLHHRRELPGLPHHRLRQGRRLRDSGRREGSQEDE